MYKILPIGGKEYKLEYTIEASLYDEGIEKLIGFFGKTLGAANEMQLPENATEADVRNARETVMRDLIPGISNLPSTALTIFYAGLMEHHGISGDNTVPSKKEAKEVVKEYFKDHADDGTDNFYDLLMICINQMGEDGFFKRTGLEKMLEQGMEETPAKTPKKKPQDHKQKAGAKQS